MTENQASPQSEPKDDQALEPTTPKDTFQQAGIDTARAIGTRLPGAVESTARATESLISGLATLINAGAYAVRSLGLAAGITAAGVGVLGVAHNHFDPDVKEGMEPTVEIAIGLMNQGSKALNDAIQDDAQTPTATTTTDPFRHLEP